MGELRGESRVKDQLTDGVRKCSSRACDTTFIFIYLLRT